MERGHIKHMPVLFPGMGSPLETEIRRIEFDWGRGVRMRRAEENHERQ